MCETVLFEAYLCVGACVFFLFMDKALYIWKNDNSCLCRLQIVFAICTLLFTFVVVSQHEEALSVDMVKSSNVFL